MSDYVSIQIAMKLKPDAPGDLADRIMNVIGVKGNNDTSDAEVISLNASVEIPAMRIPAGVDGAAVIEGRLYVDAYSCNAQRPRERNEGRSDLSVLVDLLDTYGDEPLGAIVGAVSGDWSQSDAGPMIVTGEGVAIFTSGYDSTDMNHGFGAWFGTPEPERVSMTSIDPVVAARLTRGDMIGWSGGWGSCTSEDEAEIVAWARAQPVQS